VFNTCAIIRVTIWEYVAGGSVTTRKKNDLRDILPLVQHSINSAEVSTGKLFALVE
jgi:hypothetical protein